MKPQKRIWIPLFILTVLLITLLATLSVSATDRVRGDFNVSEAVDIDDALYLLRHTLMPNRYSITQNGDINGDGTVNVDDALYLLRHTIMPSRYPLACDHIVVIDAEVRPTCTSTGLTEGTHCSFCNVVLVPQKVIDATGHSFGEWHQVEAGGCSNVAYSLRICYVCGYVEYDCEFMGEMHPHEFILSGTPPTCTTSGQAILTCSSCGVVGANEIIQPLGHNLNWVLTETTHMQKCIREGCDFSTDVEEHTTNESSPCVNGYCTVCGYQMREEIGHIWSLNYNANETEHWITCTRSECNYVKEHGIHRNANAICTDETVLCEICSAEFDPGFCHGMGEWYVVTPATCTETGLMQSDCVYCDYCETRPIPKTRHDMGAWYITLEPTETEAGAERRDCNDCDYYETRVVSATGHHFGYWYITLEPTCTESGQKRRDCSECDYYETRTVYALGHYCTKWYTVTAATCTTSGSSYGYCTRCGTYMTRIDPALGHKWGDYLITASYHYRICTVCGVHGERGAHRGGTNTCSEGAKCSVCRYVYGAATGHRFATTYSYSDSTHYYRCENGCGTRKDEARHTLTAVSETIEVADDGVQIKYTHKLNMVCATCGYCKTVKEVIGSEHYGCEIMAPVEPTCTQSGLTIGWKCAVPGCDEIYEPQETIPALGHEYVGGVCIRCGLREDGSGSGGGGGFIPPAHICSVRFYIVTVEATCTINGERQAVCSCGKILATETIVLGHDEKSHAGKAATCTEAGWEAYVTCERDGCDYSTYKVIPALGHDPVTDAAVSPTCTETGLTEGSHCALCEEIIVPQEIVDALAHDAESYEGKDATCTEAGWKAYDTCKRDSCGYSTYEAIPALGHDIENHAGKAATCTEAGWEAYVTCKRDGCGYSTYKVIPALGHDEKSHAGKAATCTEAGWEAYVTCERDGCDYSTYKVIPALGHNYVDFVCSRCRNVKISEGLEYTLNGDGQSYTVTGGTCTDTEIGIPSIHEGLPVTVIGNGAFYNCTNLASVKIPNSVERIGVNAFRNCTSLESVTIPDSVTSIGGGAFNGCTSLIYNTYGNAKYLGNASNPYYALIISVNNSITSCTIHPNTKVIAGFAFSGTSLTSIDIPDNVESIGDGAFYECNSLTSVTIGNGVTSIGEETFFWCWRIENVTIENSVEIIGKSAFSGCEGLTSIDIPDSVTSIGEYAFESCIALSDVVLWNPDTVVDETAFDGCPVTCVHRAVATETVEATCTEIGLAEGYHCRTCEATIVEQTIINALGHNYVDFVCSRCKEVKLCDGLKYTLNDDQNSYTVTGIDDTCTDTEIGIPATYEGLPVTAIGNNAFKNLTSITAVRIPDSVTSIGTAAFQGCTSIKSITIPGTVKTVKNHAFYNCTGLTSVTIENGVESIENYTFNYCTNLTSISIPDSITAISNGMLANCTSLTSVQIPSSVTSIGDYAFWECSSLKSIVIPQSVTGTIGECAFYYCTSLESAVINASSIGYKAFFHCEALTSVTFGNGVGLIDWYAFSYCTSLKNVTIPDHVKTVYGGAFDNCHALESVRLPEGLTKIDDWTFYNCTNLKSITIPNTVTSIGREPFFECANLKSVTIPEGVTSIGFKAFIRCTSLEEVSIPKSVTSIEEDAFYGCTGLNAVYIYDIVAWFGISFSNDYSNPLYYAENLYLNGTLVNFVRITGTVYESDNDTDNSNNTVLTGVSATLMIHGKTYTAESDSSGIFGFESIPSGIGTLTFILDGYIRAEVSVDITTDEHLTVVMDRNVSNTLTGKVVVADTDNTLSNNLGLAGAKVTITRITSTNAFHYETTTDASGYYTFTDLTAGVYRLTVEMEGYISITQTVQVRYNQTTVSNIALEAISSENTQPGYASGTITESLTSSPVSGLTVYIYPGINNTSGAFVDKVTTNASGYYITNPLAPGNYTAYVVDERELAVEELRYTSLAVSIKVMPSVTIPNQNGTVSNNSGLSIDGMRIVLTWGATPRDLDSHLNFGSNHVYYSQKTIGTSSLDTDDITAYGPETITISAFGDYTYSYYIHNYSQSGTMSNAQACVTVYFGNSSTPAYVFYPPTGSGYTWNVFTYNAVTGEFTVVNTLG